VKRLLLVLAACSGGNASKPAANEEAPRIVHAARGQVSDRVLVTGRLDSTSSEELRVPRTDAWELPIRWMAEDGAAVKKGERVLEFDNSQFTASLEEKKLAVLDAISAFNTFEGVTTLELQTKQFALQSARISLDKAKVLAGVPEDLLAGRTYQERQLEMKRAQAAVEQAEKDYKSAKATAELDRKVKQIELDKAKTQIANAETAIKALVLIAPRDGVAIIGDHPWEGRKFQVGDTVQPGWTIVEMPDFSAGMEVRAQLSDVDDGRVSVGMSGTCTLDAYPANALPCTVKDLMPVATGDRKSLRRGFSMVLTLENPDRERMRPGMAVKVELKRAPLTALVVPRGAVQFSDDGKARVKIGSALREVELDGCDAQGCAVKTGITERDELVMGGKP
jgi:multidrug efflux pump subunit AcrA (membrane-fusion protein)